MGGFILGSYGDKKHFDVEYRVEKSQFSISSDVCSSHTVFSSVGPDPLVTIGTRAFTLAAKRLLEWVCQCHIVSCPKPRPFMPVGQREVILLRAENGKSGDKKKHLTAAHSGGITTHRNSTRAHGGLV